MRQCSVDGCDNPAKNRGWCPKHYMRWWKHGDPTITHRRPAVPVVDRIEAKRRITGTGCWEFTGGTTAEGYGTIWKDSKGDSVYGKHLVHRAYYEATVGPIPPKHDLHHLCANPPCFRPDHLEVLTRAAHIAAERLLRPPRTHCVNGHEWIPENLYTAPGSETTICGVCKKQYGAPLRERLRRERVARVMAEATDDELLTELRFRYQHTSTAVL